MRCAESGAACKIHLGIRRMQGGSRDSSGDLVKNTIAPYSSISPVCLRTLVEYRNFTIGIEIDVNLDPERHCSLWL